MASPGRIFRGQWSVRPRLRDRTTWLPVLLALAVTGHEACAADLPRPAREKPNIVFIFSDDYGIPGVGCYGGKYATPQLDALASTGLRFERCYAMPLCAPSRALALSGQYPFRNGVLDNGLGEALSPEKTTTFAKVLQQAGYKTAVAGKWRQLQYLSTPAEAQAWGFDEFMVWGLGKGERYWEPDYNHNGQPLSHVDQQYGPDVLQKFVFDFMARHRDQPFCVYYPTPLVHGPILPTPDSPAADKSKKSKSASFYPDNVAYLDKLVGSLVAEIGRLGLRDNTVIVFTGDNGSVGNDLTIHGRPIVGSKGKLLEGGSRVPLIVSWPGVTPAGRVLPDLVDFSDFYVTFAELAGATLPAGVKLDGHSFAPQIRGEAGQPRSSVFVQLGAAWYARNERWKLNHRGELFDLAEAPYVERPIASTDSDPAVRSARDQLQQVLDTLAPEQSSASASGKSPAKKAKKKAKRAEKKSV